MIIQRKNLVAFVFDSVCFTNTLLRLLNSKIELMLFEEEKNYNGIYVHNRKNRTGLDGISSCCRSATAE